MMQLYGAYIITNDGRPIIWQVFQAPDQVPNGGLLSPLLASIQNVSSDLVKKEGGTERFTMSGITYHMQHHGDFFVVLVTDTEEKPKIVLNKVGWHFMARYKEEITGWDGNLATFEDFIDPFLEILHKNFRIDESQSIDPSKQLDTSALFKLDKSMKQTAYTIFELQSATAEQISTITGEEVTKIREELQKLQELGYLGTRVKGDEVEYFY